MEQNTETWGWEKVGHGVMDASGRVGIIVEPQKLSGPSKGKVLIHWQGQHATYSARPAELELVTLRAE